MDTLPVQAAPVHTETIDPTDYATWCARCALADLSDDQIRQLVREIMAERMKGGAA